MLSLDALATLRETQSWNRPGRSSLLAEPFLQPIPTGTAGSPFKSNS